MFLLFEISLLRNLGLTKVKAGAQSHSGLLVLGLPSVLYSHLCSKTHSSFTLLFLAMFSHSSTVYWPLFMFLCSRFLCSRPRGDKGQYSAIPDSLKVLYWYNTFFWRNLRIFVHVDAASSRHLYFIDAIAFTNYNITYSSLCTYSQYIIFIQIIFCLAPHRQNLDHKFCHHTHSSIFPRRDERLS